MNRQHYWRNGEPTKAGVVAFTEGDCWILAIHLSRRTGWPVYVVGDNRHWVVRVPGEDRYLDITGVRTRKALLSHWDALSLTLCDSILLDYAHQDVLDRMTETFSGSHRRAPGIARRLLDKYGVRG